MPTQLIKPLLIALLLAGVFAGGWYKGYSGEHDKLTAYQAQIDALGKAQEAQAALVDKHAQEAAQNAQQAVKTATDNIRAYYRDHPVIRVRTVAGLCEVSGADSDTVKPDDTAASDNATAYVSEYDPEQVEQVASRLDLLQKLLVMDRVVVK